MAELKNMTVQALRELARKALGRGHSKLKTKSELVAALQSAGKNVSTAAEKAAARVKAVTQRAAKATGRAAKAAEKMVTKAKASRPARKAAAKGKARAAAARPAPRPPRAAPPPPARDEAPPRAPERRDEPDADGYFVARVRGEDAVRDAPHPMTEGALDEPRAEPPRKAGRAPRRFEEGLGELPWSYDDDALVALPRDPRTLYVYWDHRGETLRGAFEGLEDPRAQIWVLARTDDGGWERVRTVEFALESRSWFVHDLDPGRVYRAEIHLVDRRGRSRQLQEPSNEMQLPRFGPSPVIDDKFMRIDWSEPLQRLLRHVREGAPFPEELRAILSHLSDWSRFVPPTWGGSGSGSGPGGAAGGPGGRPSGPSGGPSSPSSPFGPYGWGSGSGEGR